LISSSDVRPTAANVWPVMLLMINTCRFVSF
jgi:hypothetical protein